MKAYHYLITFLFCLIQLAIVCSLDTVYADFTLYERDEFKIVLTPNIYLEEEYTDNLFLTRDKKHEWITTAGIGFNFTLLHPKGSIDFSSSVGFEYYARESTYDLEGSQNQNLSTTIDLTSRLSLSLLSQYRRTNDTLLESTTEDGETDYSYRRNNRSTINIIRNTPSLTYLFGSENSLAISYTNIISNSDDAGEDDFVSHSINTSLSYWFNIKNGAQLSFIYRKANFDTDTDLLNSYKLNSHFIHRFTPHLEVSLGGSVELTDFEEATILILSEENGSIVRTLKRADIDDEDIYTCDIGFNYALSPTLSLAGFFGYYWRKGFDDDEDGLDARISFNKIMRKLNYSVSFSKGYNTEYFSYRDSGSYEYWRLSTTATYLYSPKLNFTISASYQSRDYSNSRSSDELVNRIEGRDDDIYRTTFLMRYQFLQNLYLDFEFRHNETDSNRPEDYYIENRCIGRITAEF